MCLGLSKSLGEFGLGSSNFGCVLNCERSGWENGAWADWDVSSCDSEAVDGVGDVVDTLEETVGVDVAVRSAGNTIGSVDLLLGRVDVLKNNYCYFLF